MMNFIDLFSGCGGMTLGFEHAGFNPLGGIEIDSTASQTHALNFLKNCGKVGLKKHSDAHDIIKLSPENFMEKILEANDPKGLVDIIVGGAPCQAFARVGRAKLREIMNHPEAFLKDARANLYLHYLEYVEFFRPFAVIMENVPDIMNFGKTNVAEEIAISLEDMGYRCRYTIMNSAYYGVPQMRQRFYLMGIREDLDVDPEFPSCTHYIQLPQGYENARMVALSNSIMSEPLFNDETHYVSPPVASPDLPDAISAKEAIRDLPVIDVKKLSRGARKFDKLSKYRDDIEPSLYVLKMRNWSGFESEEGVYDHVTRYLPRDYKLFEKMKPGDQYPEAYRLAQQMFEDELKKYKKNGEMAFDKSSEKYLEMKNKYIPPYDPGKFPNKWRKMEPDKPARTLTAHIGKDTYSHIHYDSKQSRVISVREAARLQSFPDGFKFSGAMNAAFRQIGNAVPPLQAYAIAIKLKQLINKTTVPQTEYIDREKETVEISQPVAALG